MIAIMFLIGIFLGACVGAAAMMRHLEKYQPKHIGTLNVISDPIDGGTYMSVGLDIDIDEFKNDTDIVMDVNLISEHKNA